MKQKLNAFLKSCGGDLLEDFIIYKGPEYFLLGSSALGMLCCFLGLSFSKQTGLIGFAIGCLLPGFILYMSNEQDNKVILKDLKWMYETISVQLEAGLHIQQALLESEGMMKNKRLKHAFRRLAEGLINGEDTETLLYRLEHSFRNHYIDSFCLILRQMQDSGYAVKLLGDIRLQLEEMELTQLKQRKEALEMQLQIFQLLLFAGIVVLVMYGCILAVSQNVNIF